MMIFLNSNFLWFLLLLSIPVLVHLFDFRRIRTIRFSNVNFLNSLKKSSTPRKKLAEFLILLTRLLAICFLVFAFAEPVLRDQNSGFNGSNVLVVDNSYSLQAQCETKDCQVEIGEVVLSVADGLEAGSIVSIGAFRPKSFYGANELTVLLNDIKLRKGHLHEISIDNNQVVLFSDFDSEVLEWLNDNDSVGYTLVPMVKSLESNVTVDSVYLSRNRGDDLTSRTIHVDIRNNGTKERRNVLVRLVAKDQQIGSTAMNLGSNERKQIEFQIENENFRDFAVVVNDREVPFDNEFYFVLPEVSKFNVCLVSNAREPSLEAVFGNEGLFDFAAFNSGNVDFERVFSADVLLLNSFEELPNWFELEKFDGHVVIIPSVSIDLDNYSEKLGFRVVSAVDTTENAVLPSSLRHPFYNGIFDELNDRVELPMVRSFYRTIGGDILMDGEQPFLKYHESQRVYMFAGSLSGGNSRLASHSIFLPLIYRIVESSRSYNDPLSYELNEDPIQMSVEYDSESVPFLVNESGRFIPEFSYSSSGMVFTLPYELNDPGIYYLMTGTDTLDRVALNYPRSETKLDFNTYEDLAEYFKGSPNVKIIDASSPERLKATMDQFENGTPLWKYALILALMFLLSETAIHRWLK